MEAPSGLGGNPGAGLGQPPLPQKAEINYVEFEAEKRRFVREKLSILFNL